MPERWTWMFVLSCSLLAVSAGRGESKPYLAIIGPPPLRFFKAPEIPLPGSRKPSDESNVAEGQIEIVPKDQVDPNTTGMELTADGALVGDPIGSAGDPVYMNAATGGFQNWVQNSRPISMQGIVVAADPAAIEAPRNDAGQTVVDEEIQEAFTSEATRPVVPRVFVPLSPELFVPPNAVTSPGSSAVYRVVPR